jgi:hypothetical protein
MKFISKLLLTMILFSAGFTCAMKYEAEIPSKEVAAGNIFLEAVINADLHQVIKLLPYTSIE